MDKPILSVVIPVKNNTGTLLGTINSVVRQSYSNIEIVVSNNSRQDGIKEIVDEFNDQRIKYICPDRILNFSGDWNFALSGATGDFVTFLGDDDAALPNGYEAAMNLLSPNPNYAFTWRKLNYNWPNHIIPQHRDFLIGEYGNQYVRMNAKKALRLFSYFLLGYSELPCIYNSIVPHTAIQRVISKTSSKKFFAGVIPDVYSSFALANELEYYYYSDFSLTLNGASDKSSGVLQGLSIISNKQKKLIPDAMESGTDYHKDIGPFSSSIASIALGEYLLAKDLIKNFSGINPSWFMYVLYLIREAKFSQKPSAILAAAQFTAKRRMLPIWVSQKNSIPKQISSASFRGSIKLNPKVIKNAEDASILLSDLHTTPFLYKKMSILTFLRNTISTITENFIKYLRYFATR